MGMVVYDGDTFREYNSLNQLSKVFNGSDNTTLLAEYTYHPVEERVLMKKVYEGGVWKETIYYISDSFVSKKNSSGLYNETYVHLNGVKIAQVVDGEKQFIHSDHLGSSSVVTNESGGIIETTLYDPYGGVLSGGESSRYDYESRENEPFGTMDFRFRQYSPEYGIFYQPDALIPGIYNPQNLNRYMFEGGNPLNNIDADGHSFTPFDDHRNFFEHTFNPIWENIESSFTQTWENSDLAQIAEGVYYASPVSGVVSLADWALSEFIYQVEESVGAEEDVFRIIDSDSISSKRESAAFSAANFYLGGQMTGKGSKFTYGLIDSISGFFAHRNILQFSYEGVDDRIKEYDRNKQGINVREDPYAVREKIRRNKIKANFPEYYDEIYGEE